MTRKCGHTVGKSQEKFAISLPRGNDKREDGLLPRQYRIFPIDPEENPTTTNNHSTRSPNWTELQSPLKYYRCIFLPYFKSMHLSC